MTSTIEIRQNAIVAGWSATGPADARLPSAASHLRSASSHRSQPVNAPNASSQHRADVERSHLPTTSKATTKPQSP